MQKQKILDKINFADFYQTHLQKFQANGNAKGKGCCPFHPDENPSLSVDLSTGQYYCFVCRNGGGLVKFYMRLKSVSFSQALTELSDYSCTDATKQTEVVYPYTDEDGKLLFEVVRFVPKTFRQRRPDGKGGYIWNLDGIKIVPYRLPEVKASDTVFICEGEKDCNHLTNIGLAATTNPQGAGKWRGEFSQYFTGKDIVIICDNDEPGAKHGQDVAQKLSRSAKSIKVVSPLTGVPTKGDVSDWLKIPANDKGKLLELVKSTSLWSPQANSKNESTMPLTRLGDLFLEREESTSWLVDDLLPSGGFSILVAKPKVGKSTLARTLMLCVSNGEDFLDRAVTQGAVIYLCLEEKRAEVKKHFLAMGASGNEEIYIYAGSSPTDAIKQIQGAVEGLKPVLVVIDPLFRLAKVKDGNDYVQVTNALDPLLRLARDTGTHVLCVHHSPKGERGVEDAVLGSQAIFGSVDTLLVMKRHEHYRTLQTRQRYGNDLEETTMNFNKETRIVSLGETRQEEDANTVRNTIMDFLSTQSEPVTETIITNEVEGRTTIKRKTLRELVEKGSVKRDGKGGKGA